MLEQILIILNIPHPCWIQCIFLNIFHVYSQLLGRSERNDSVETDSTALYILFASYELLHLWRMGWYSITVSKIYYNKIHTELVKYQHDWDIRHIMEEELDDILGSFQEKKQGDFQEILGCFSFLWEIRRF